MKFWVLVVVCATALSGCGEPETTSSESGPAKARAVTDRSPQPAAVSRPGSPPPQSTPSSSAPAMATSLGEQGPSPLEAVVIGR